MPIPQVVKIQQILGTHRRHVTRNAARNRDQRTAGSQVTLVLPLPGSRTTTHKPHLHRNHGRAHEGIPIEKRAFTTYLQTPSKRSMRRQRVRNDFHRIERRIGLTSLQAAQISLIEAASLAKFNLAEPRLDT
jgi:hypothetical protein